MTLAGEKNMGASVQGDAARVFAAAQDHHRAGRLAEAVAGYRHCLALKPDSVPALISLGIALHGQAAYGEAVATLQRALALAPRSYDAQYNLAAILAEQRRPDDAIAAYRAALAIEPQAPAAWNNLGLLLKERGRLDEAIECFTRAVAAAPHLAVAHGNLGNALYDAGERAAALEALRRAVALEPANSRHQAALGQKLEKTGDLRGAEAALRQALSVRPGQVDALALLPLVLQRLGRDDEAAAILACERLLRTHRLADVAPWPDLRTFNADLIDYIYRHPTLQRDPPGKATQNGSQTLELFRDEAPPMAALRRFIAGAIEDYMASAFPTAPGIFPARPARWEIRGWAVVLRSGGYQTPHYHPSGIISGVYYARVPQVVARGGAGEAGHIKFGEGTTEAPEARLTTTIKPEEGLLVQFPSFYWHRTMPFASDEDRICVAFDVIPLG